MTVAFSALFLLYCRDYYKNVQISVKLAINAVTITVTVPPGFLKMESAAESPMMLNKQKSQLFGPSFTFSNTTKASISITTICCSRTVVVAESVGSSLMRFVSR